MLKAIIFDMDGILIDSEPLWQEAQKAVFGNVGIRLTTTMCRETMGLRVDQVVRYRFQRQPWSGKTVNEVEQEILEELVWLIRDRGERMAGVDYILDFLKSADYRIALASSTYLRIISVVLRKLELEETFEVIHSAEFEHSGKPDPAIYLTMLRKLHLSSSEVLAFEDSHNGILSAKRAGLKVVAIPEDSAWPQAKFDIADLKLRSLSDFHQGHLNTLNEA